MSTRARKGAGGQRQRAGLSDIVQVVAAMSFSNPEGAGDVRLRISREWKRTTSASSTWLPAARKGGLFLAHNVVNKRSEMGDFLDAIQKQPSVWTTIVSPSGEGMSVTLRR